MISHHVPWVLGISASHNGAVCLLKGDEIVVAIQEERLTRIKRDLIYGAQHSLALAYCLDYAGIQPADLDLVVLTTVDSANDPGHDLQRNPQLRLAQHQVPAITISHHLAHAISAFATSGFSDSAVLVVDGRGSPCADLNSEEQSVVQEDVESGSEIISLYYASGTSLVPIEKHLVGRGAWLTIKPHDMPSFASLGGMFASVAQQIFGSVAEAGKVMGLAQFGTPAIPATDFFDIANRSFRFHDTVPNRFAHNDRWPLREKEYQNLASSVQAALEVALLYLTQHLRHLSPNENLCYAGGVALNSVANERIIREAGYRNVFITPAAEDSGAAIGAAYYGLWQITEKNTQRSMTHDASGRVYDSASVTAAIEKTHGVRSLECQDAITEAVDLLCEGKILGWFDGRSELGPRALGQRSIICDPRRADAKEILNNRVKKREPFRPFAPVILLEQVADWFELDGTDPASPFMLRVCRFRAGKEAEVPAVVHVDSTGRLQTVTREANGRFYELVRKFYERTGVPILLNTSFNVQGQPIVETPEDAILCLLSSGLDACVFSDRIVFRCVES